MRDTCKGKGIMKSRLSISFPRGLYARIIPRFGLAIGKFIDVGIRVADQNCRGEIGVSCLTIQMRTSDLNRVTR